MKPVVGMIGLGIMGSAMAEALLAQGYRVTGYDIRVQACRRLKKTGGQPLASATAVARGADIVITSLATTAALDATVEKIAASKHAGLIVVETSTCPSRTRSAHCTRSSAPASKPSIARSAARPCA